MQIRRYTKADVPQMVELLEEGLKDYGTYAKILYDPNTVGDRLIGNLRNPSFFCHVVDDGEIGGALCGSIVEYMFSHEVYAEHHITYIREGHRSLKAITGLVTNYKSWAKSRDARQIRWGQSTGFKMEKFAVLAKRLGFTQIGTNWNMEIKG